MWRTRSIQRVAVCLATAGVCLCQPAFATGPHAGQTPVVTDVRLHESGVLIGQVVTPENRPVPGVRVALHTAGKQVAVAQSEKHGYFAFNGLQNGIYQLVTPKGAGVYRVWTHATAPPSAHLGVLLIDGDGIVRGRFLGHNFNLAVITAALVAIPVILVVTDEPSSP